MKKIVAIAVVLACFVQAEDAPKGVSGLSSDVRTLLSQEMLEIEKGMQSIFTYMVKGEYEEIEKTATKIENSFIFKKKLTQEQRKELKDNLPKSFIELDRSFHAIAGKLARSAELGDTEEVEKNFAEMTKTCIKCHSTYATQRFSSFAE